MNIILDAFFDNNFGDDLFITTVLSRYPKATFYVFWNKVHPAVMERASDYPNLRILPGNCLLMDDFSFDGYVMVGGDVFMNWGDYSRRIGYMRAVKDSGGFVALQGFSLYEEYCEQTVNDLRTMMALADVIVPRDNASADRLERMIPNIQLVRSADMAFTTRYETVCPTTQDILGVAPRRKYMAEDRQHADYCASMAAIIDEWLAAHPEGMARFLAFSTGEFDDAEVSREIIGCMQRGDRTEIAAHDGGLESFLAQLQGCTAMLPTRFHALVFALIYHIPFVPVTYEVKLHQLLDELGYTGLRLPYGERFRKETISQAAAELEVNGIDPDALAAYYTKADLFFVRLDELMEQGKAKGKADAGEYICTGMDRLQREVAVLRKELEETRARCDVLTVDNDTIRGYYNDLLAKSKSFKGLAYLLAKKILRIFIKEKA